MSLPRWVRIDTPWDTSQHSSKAIFHLREALSIAIEALESIKAIQSDGSNGMEACIGEAEEAIARIEKMGDA